MTLTIGQTTTAEQAHQQLAELRDSVSRFTLASYERGKAVPDLVSDPAHYEKARQADEAARLAFEQHAYDLERLILALIHHRDTAPTT